MNRGESGIIVRALQELGNELVHDSSDADVALIATCIVIESTERKILKRLRALSSLNIPLAVTGCAGAVFPEKICKAAPSAVTFAPGDTHGPAEYLGSTARQARRAASCDSDNDPRNKPYAAGQTITKRPRLANVTKIPFAEEGDAVYPIPIASGCTGSCAYCITRMARGGLKSKPTSEVLEEARLALENGATELQLCAQDSGVYGNDIGGSLPELMSAVSSLEGEFMIRVGMMNPGSVKDSFPELLDAYDNPKIFKFLHLPVQSGDDAVLASMNRRYTADVAMGLIDSFRRRFPESTITTDVIVGYPGEGSEAHGATRRFLEIARPDMVNVTRFSPRPGTSAFGMGGVPHGRVVKARSRELSILWVAIAEGNNRQWLGKKLKVLALETGKSMTTMGRTSGYRLVIIPKRVSLGKCYTVRIHRTNSINLFGKLE